MVLRKEKTFKCELYINCAGLHSDKIKDMIDILRWEGFHKMSLKHAKIGIREWYISKYKNSFIEEAKDLTSKRTGIRTQGCDKNGNLIDEFLIIEDKHSIHFCNAPSHAPKTSLSIVNTIIRKLKKDYDNTKIKDN